MGTIYINGKEVVSYSYSGEKVIDKTGSVLAYYNESNGDIYQKASVANNYFAVYRHGRIYRKSGFSESEVGKIISESDWNGYDGKIVDSSGNTIALYHGEDSIGLAAAAAIAVFHLDRRSSDDVQNYSGGCISAIVGILIFILLLVPLFLWKFLPSVLCICLFAEVILDGGIDFTHDADSLIIFIPLMISGICNIWINFNSIRSKISKKQSNLCRLIMNAGTILGLITFVMYNNSYETPLGLVSAANAESTPLGIFFGVISVIIFCLTPVVTYLFLRKCKKINKN